MKLLLLMPCDGRTGYAATTIYNSLPADVKEKTFAMPMFMEYLESTKMVGNTVMAFFDSLVSAEHLYKASADEDFILIGNIGKEYEFDAVFNFQDIEADGDYEDKMLERIRPAIIGEPVLASHAADLHKANESIMPLHNCRATADFISDYISTDPHFDKLKAIFVRRLKEAMEAPNVSTSK